MTHDFKLAQFQNHIGHCQLNYVTRNSLGQKIFYCLQDSGEKFGGIRLMRCTSDFEPSYEVRLLKPVNFERPIINEYDSDYAIKLKTLCNRWIDENNKIK